ncbi:hypothetical protein RhiirA1_465551 [Rhizophagus irregularis]|uniref:Uncharacterized protein n=2 Tax=Rhizophagus irregularis TaxID=588596 RepID=A0A2N0RFU1_9GLOM|nr:hypothetical protein GLOIN_2v1780723 [Rhizophagus irregularis DAOM 181602=DAOM 197198]PKC62150.1 hypothetical protein RhiirA1_465551 [Rhizophagus irregularis]POG66307.1 hypothetical protein GLOIN_2v1780723 [Rhizophagus irregularis DAOM 181602=DAOM 197198]|eukprot:XP_025173173.1 hypothetical protein GLOIN_2v1780723 [Rhizophagus irregularis DAOM 181602=DAOM 197198]
MIDLEFGKQKVIVKKLENVKSADRSWFEEAESLFYMQQMDEYRSMLRSLIELMKECWNSDPDKRK